MKVLSKIAVAAAIAIAYLAPAQADDAEIRASIAQLFPKSQIDSVRESDIKGLYEVVMGTEVIYSDRTGAFVIDGSMFDARTRRNITEDRREQLSKVDFSTFPLDMAVKEVKGDGSRVFVTFEDPNCGWCKKLHHGLATLNNYTHYTFLLPLLGPDSLSKVRAVMCATDKNSAWSSLMASGTAPAPRDDCEAPVTKLMSLRKQYAVQGTPTIYFADGTKAGGYLPAEELERRFNRAVLATSQKVGTRTNKPSGEKG